MRISSREKRLVAAAFAVAALLAVDRFAVRPAWEAWQGLDADLAHARARVIRDRRLLARKESLLEEGRVYASVKGPAGRDGAALVLKDIEAAARRAGAGIRDVKPRATAKGFAVQVQTESSWESLSRFLHDLHRSPRLLRVEKASLRLKSEVSPVIETQLLIEEVGS